MTTRKFKVKVKLVKLEFELSNNGWNEGGGGGDVEKKENVVVVKLKWKGEPKFGLVPFHRTSKRRIDFSTEKKVDKRGGVVLEWDDEFENVCSFSIVSSNDQKFGPWDISFSIIGEKMESKPKLGVIGRVSLNLAEMVSMMQPEVERKLPVNLHFGGVAIEANLLVLLKFVELRDSSKDSEGNSENPVHSTGYTSEEGETKTDNLGGPFTIDNDNTTASETGLVNEMGMSMRSEKEIESVKKVGFFSWKRRRLRFSPTSLKGGEPLDKNTGSCIIDDDDDDSNNYGTDIDLQSNSSSMVDSATTAPGGGWESKEFISRDGETKVKTDVFFASFDQCSNKAAGEGACTALVAVIAHWLQLNPDAMPTRSEFDNLIVQGSQEWRKLCEIDTYMNNFPNKHFDLETVLGAGIRPISISHNDSFVGFFSPEKFESLKEAMSFDEIWDGINKIISGEHDDEQRIYIVSWNDHFFVLKVDADACYIIDTLGARLFEGCNQAYILRFDKSSMMYGKKTLQEEEGEAKKTGQIEEEQQMICRGKECCKEFMKRFLAAIPLQELEAEEKKGGPVSYYSLHHRLQIELNFSYLLSSSSLASSPFSSSSPNRASSCSTDESCRI